MRFGISQSDKYSVKLEEKKNYKKKYEVYYRSSILELIFTFRISSFWIQDFNCTWLRTAAARCNTKF